VATLPKAIDVNRENS